MRIERHYNCYTFTFDNGKVLVIDCDNQEIIGVSGKKLKTPYYSNTSHYLPNIFHKNLTDILTDRTKEYIDRLISLIGDEIDEYLFYSYSTIIENSTTEQLNKNWRDAVALFKKRVPRIDKFDNIEQALNRYAFYEKIAKDESFTEIITTLKNNLPEYNYGIVMRDIMALYNYKCGRASIKHYYNYIALTEEYHNKIYDMVGTNDNQILKLYGISLSTKNNIIQFKEKISDLSYKLASIQRMLDDMQMSYSITNIERDYEDILATYKKEITRIEEERFANNQNKYNLYFSYDKYDIFVPHSRKELAKIGKYFNNCANNFEWRTYLSKGYRMLVVVKNKETNTFLVCCDIMEVENTLYTIQYLGESNKQIEDKSLIKFREKYDEYLKGLK